METIIKSQQAELITLHETTHTLKDELSASEQRTTFLKDIVKEFSATLATSRADLKGLERHCQALQFEICCLKNPTASPRDLKVRFDEEQHQQQERMRRHNMAVLHDSSSNRTGTLAATIGRELETRALASQIVEARNTVTLEFGAMASLNAEVAAIERSTRLLARKNAVLARDNAALQQRIGTDDNDGGSNNSSSISIGSGGSSDGKSNKSTSSASVDRSSEPEPLLEEDEEAEDDDDDDSELQHELSSAATTRSSASSEDIGAMCFPRKFHVHHELTELRARRLVSGGDLHSSYENIGPIRRK
jgi:hypothetical protein